MKLSKRIVALLALLATPLSPAAQAMDFQAGDYEVGNAVICDTKLQAERFVDLFSGDATAAIGVVNAEQHDPTACGIANVAYIRGRSVEIARHGDDAFEIMRVLVIGMPAEGAIRPVRPAAYFSLLRIKEFAV